MASREISGLKWARLIPGRPPRIPAAKNRRGSRAKGLAFERRVGKKLSCMIQRGELNGKLFSGHWIEFEDENGRGYAQPDHFVLTSNRIILVECKLTQRSAAWIQLRRLYKPLLEHIFGQQVICVQSCHNLREDGEDIVSNFLLARDGAIWHYIH